MLNLISRQLLIFKSNIEIRYSYRLRIINNRIYPAQFWSVETNQFNLIKYSKWKKETPATRLAWCTPCFLFWIQKYLTTLFRSRCENWKWNNGVMYQCRDHEKSLCTIWFFVLHPKCWWEGDWSKENVQECILFAKTLMKFITKWHNEYNEKQNDQILLIELRYYNEWLPLIDEKVINDKIKTFTYFFYFHLFLW